MSEGQAECKAARGGYMSTERPVIASNERYPIFINEPQI